MLIATVLLGFGSGARFFYSYLVAWLFFLTLGLGGLIFVLIQFATRAGWSVAVRRLAENTMGTLPLLVVLSLPLMFGLGELFPWFDTDAAGHDKLLAGKAGFLNPEFFYIRSILYFASWALMAWWFRYRSLQQDIGDAVQTTRTLQWASAPAIAWFAMMLGI